MRVLLVILALLLATTATAQQGIEPGDIRLELHLEDRPHPPHPGEMVLLSIQGTFRIAVVREKLRQPALDGLDWMQLGEDRWYKEFEDGFEVLKFERRMALFPQAPGEIEIAPFTHTLDLLTRRNGEIKVELISNPLTFRSEPRPETTDWWFPVRNIRIRDRWSNQPEALDPGSAALRIVSLRIDGSPPQRIPPMPELTGAGAHIFPHPEHRIVSLGPDGPITRVFWRWTIRPHQGTVGYLDPIRLVYFDAETRKTEEVTLSAQRVAYLGGPEEIAVTAPPDQAAGTSSAGADFELPSLPGWAVPGLLAAGLVIGLGLAIGRGGWALPGWMRPDSGLVAMRRAARQGRAETVRTLAHRLIGQTSEPAPAALRQLDEALYGQGSIEPDIRDVDRAVRAALATGARRQC